jgi:hypothetical protein
MSAPFRFIIETWNVRGLGDDDKCISILADFCAAKPSLLVIQESKLSGVTTSKAHSFLPPYIRDFRAIDAIGASGGLVSACDPNLFNLTNEISSRHILTLDLAFNNDGSCIRFSNIYGPCDRQDKALFLETLSLHDPGTDVPWLLASDFNLTRDPSDRNNDNFSFSEATLFNDTINELCRLELPLSDRSYT